MFGLFGLDFWIGLGFNFELELFDMNLIILCLLYIGAGEFVKSGYLVWD